MQSFNIATDSVYEYMMAMQKAENEKWNERYQKLRQQELSAPSIQNVPALSPKQQKHQAERLAKKQKREADRLAKKEQKEMAKLWRKANSALMKQIRAIRKQERVYLSACKSAFKMFKKAEPKVKRTPCRKAPKTVDDLIQFAEQIQESTGKVCLVHDCREVSVPVSKACFDFVEMSCEQEEEFEEILTESTADTTQDSDSDQDDQDDLFECKGKQFFLIDAETVPQDSELRQMSGKICERFQKTTNHMCIMALAGCGKTYTLKQLTQLPCLSGKKILYLVFNKKNAEEAQSEFHSGVFASTTNSFCGNLAKRFRKSTTYTLFKTSKIVRHVVEKSVPNLPDENLNKVVSCLGKLVSLAKSYAYDPVKSPKDILTTIFEDVRVENRVQNFDPLPHCTLDMVDRVLILCHSTKPIGLTLNGEDLCNVMDLDDQLWLFAITPSIQLPKYDLILCDEAQDFNMCQIELVRRYAESGTRVVFVGDPNQAIYKFRGSCAYSFTEIKRQLPDCLDGTLSVNFRCDPRIIEFSNRNTHVSGLKPAKQVHENRAVTTGNSRQDFIDQVQVGSAVICRNNAPLLPFMCDVVSRGFCPIVPQEKSPGSTFIEKLKAFLTTLLPEKFRKAFERSTIQDLVSITSHDAIWNLISKFGKPQDSLKSTLEKIMASLIEENTVNFMTIHKSKGLEFDQVWFVDYQNFQAKMFDQPTPEHEIQERNCEYIAFTRARVQLHLVD